MFKTFCYIYVVTDRGTWLHLNIIAIYLNLNIIVWSMKCKYSYYIKCIERGAYVSSGVNGR